MFWTSPPPPAITVAALESTSEFWFVGTLPKWEIRKMTTLMMMNLVHWGVPKVCEDTERAGVVRVKGSVVHHAVIVALLH